MKYFSLFDNYLSRIHFLFYAFILSNFFGCYSFTGGSIPDHLATIQILSVEDNSGFGNPLYRDFLTQKLFDNFRNDKSLEIIETGGDARLQVKINSIKDLPQTIAANELVGGNKVTVSCEAEYYDTIKKKLIWKKSFSSYDVYDIGNVQAGRDAAIQNALKQAADDILLAVVSGW